MRADRVLTDAGLALASLAMACPVHAAPAAPTIADIVEARSIDSLSLSPDGRKIAYRILSPSLARNRLEAQWRESNVSGEGAAPNLGNPTVPIQQPLFTIPYDGVSRWAADGKSLYVLSANDAGIQVHRLEPGGIDIQVTNDPADVVDFTLDVGAGTLRYHIFASRKDIAAAQSGEASQGIHLDRSVITDGLRLTDNFRLGGRLTTIRRIGVGDVVAEAHRGKLRLRTLPLGTERSPLAPLSTLRTTVLVSARPAATHKEIRFPGKFTIRIAMERTPGLETRGPRYQYYGIVAHMLDGRLARCTDPRCPGISNGLREATVNPDTGEIVMLVEQGQSAVTRVIGWDPVKNHVRTIYDADTSLDGGSRYSGASCLRIDHRLVCVEAGAAQPDRLVAIDLNDGALSVLDDPNARLRSMRFGSVRHLRWADKAGRMSNGVLLLPSIPTSGPVPLVITTYRCRGFLRGGTGWLAPEHILAEQGFAVLCSSTNDEGWGVRDKHGAVVPLNAHKVYLEALKAVIDRLAREGLIDPARVGITGHSFSSNMVAYAISHTSLFRAAVLGGSFDIDPFSYSLTAPTADSWRKLNFAAMGLPAPSRDPHHIWASVAAAPRARFVTAALLLQPPESEYLLSMDLYAAMQGAGIPADMFIYPHEGHMVGVEPLHQYWRNLRSVNWFSFWLLGREHRTPQTATDYDHWETLRDGDKRAAASAKPISAEMLRASHDESHASTSTRVRIRE